MSVTARIISLAIGIAILVITYIPYRWSAGIMSHTFFGVPLSASLWLGGPVVLFVVIAIWIMTDRHDLEVPR
jgi:hypothetical protein